MSVIKERVIGLAYVQIELSMGQVYCRLDMNRWPLINGVGNRMCIGTSDVVEKAAGLTQTGDMYCNAGSVFEVLALGELQGWRNRN